MIILFRLLSQSWVRVTLTSVLATLSIVLARSLINTNEPIAILIVFVVLAATNAVTDYLRKLFERDHLSALQRILASSTRESLDITTVRRFLVDTNEEALKGEAQVHILTNDLSSYDLTPPALDVIASNLIDGVKYLYYLPERDFPALKVQRNVLVEKLMGARPAPSIAQLRANLCFYPVPSPCLFNFAIVDNGRNLRGYWYLAAPTIGEEGNSDLVVIELRHDNRDQLVSVLERLRRFRQIKPQY